jgi:hypothetical protein
MGGKGNADDAVHAAVKGFVHRRIEEQLHLREVKSRHRATDSGVWIPGEDKAKGLRPLGPYVRLAAQAFELAVPGYESPWTTATASLAPAKFDLAAYVGAVLAADAPPDPATTRSTAKMMYAAGVANSGQRTALRSDQHGGEGRGRVGNRHILIVG